jgi:hypothetical protein
MRCIPTECSRQGVSPDGHADQSALSNILARATKRWSWALFGVSICACVAKNLVESFTIPLCQVGPMKRSANDIRHRVALLDTKDDLLEGERIYGHPDYAREMKLAQDFVDVLMDDDAYLPVAGGINMTYLPDIVCLETRRKYPVIIRNITESFWDACIKVLDAPGVPCRVVAVGTSGIGKTSSTPVLIRKLLKKGKTVVYHLRSNSRSRWIYQFVREGDSCRSEVYREKDGLNFIPSLQLKSTYYIVDPGSTQDSCNPHAMFEPKVVIVAEPDESHWGGLSFYKSLPGVTGTFLYYPVWSKEEIRAVKDILQPDMNDSTLNENYRLFGGVPGEVFAPHHDYAFSIHQDGAVRDLTPLEVELIGQGRMHVEGRFNSFRAKNTLMVYDLAPDDNGRFIKWRCVLVSDAIKDKVYAEHAGKLWNTMLKQEDAATRDFFLQSYVRHLLKGRPRGSLYSYLEEAHIGVGIWEEGRAVSLPITMPHFNEIRFVDAPAARLGDPESEPSVFNHARKRSNELIDCLYKDNSDNVYALQTALKTSAYPMSPDKMTAFQETLGGHKNITLYYVVPFDIPSIASEFRS